jgi:hypothetical protein
MPPAATRKPRTTRAPRRVAPKQALTPEAEAELARQGIPAAGTASEDSEPVYNPEWFPGSESASENLYGPFGDPSIQGEQPGPVLPQSPNLRPGAIIDGAIEPPDKPLISPDKPTRDTLNTGPPKADEWLDFFSRIVLKVGMDLYTDFAFRGVDEEKVNDADLRRIQIRKDERDAIARPFAEFSAKSPLMRKHGRQVVALTDSAESLVTLGIWMRRVNRVARKYRPAKAQKPQHLHIREPVMSDVSNGQNSGPTIQGSANGHIVTGTGHIVNPGSG